MAVSPKPEGRRERKKRETRERILQVAAQMFAQDGFDAVTVESLAEAADISKPTLFNYFPSKMAILQALVPEVDQRFANAIERFRLEGGSVSRQLGRFFEFGGSQTRKTPKLTRSLLVLALRGYEDTDLKPTQHRWPLMRGSFEALLSDGVARGEVRSDISIERLTHYITSVYVYGLLNWLADPQYSVETELAIASQFLGSAVAAERALSPTASAVAGAL
ncbi:TetR/AcrR family transcriptional regulator [Haliea atlantica]|jgi:AcrR family transcriptional regulator